LRFSFRSPILIGALLLLAGLQSFAANGLDPLQPGPFQFQSAEYKFPATVDKEVLSTAATEIWAKAFWPNDLSKPRPIVFLLHGNHPTCGEGNPRVDVDCSYTNEGSCPAGQTVVLNHEGYNYLGKQLASLGYIVVSINANRGITCGGGNGADWGLNLARGRLILRHIEQWKKWATEGGAPASLGIAPDAFVGHVDLTNVGLMGHSRGGEGVRAAYNLYRDKDSIWPAKIPDLQIRGIFEIGAVDGQTDRVLDADDTAWNALVPMCDGDVSDLEGRMPFERMISKHKETRKTPKSLTMVYGANHNFFNTEWRTSDSSSCQGHESISGSGPESEKQQKIAAGEMSAFFLANVGAEKQPAMLEVFDPRSKLPTSLTSITRIDRDHIYTYDEMFSAVVDDFDQPTGQSSARKTNQASGIQVDNVREEKPNHAAVKWTASNAAKFLQVNWTDAGQGRNISAYTSLDFRVGRMQDQLGQPATDFSVVLIDADNKASSPVSVSRYIELTGPASYVDLYQTVRIPLQDFSLSADKKIQGVRFVFDKSPAGSLNFANVRFTRNDPGAFASSLTEILTPLEGTPSTEESEPLDPFQTDVKNNGWTINLPAPTPPPAAKRVKSSRAKLLKAKFVANSPYFEGEPAYEIAVQAEKNFPVEAELPTLNIAGNKFSVSRYPSNGIMNVLIFSVNKSDFKKLPATGEAQVQYGRTNPSKIWKMPAFEKSSLRF
jgi:hypothetical protein